MTMVVVLRINNSTKNSHLSEVHGIMKPVLQ